MEYADKTKKQLIQELRKLRQRIDELESKESEQKIVEEVYRKGMHELNERIKELNILYAISEIFEKNDISLEEVYEKVVNLIPLSWQYPEITCARITMEGKKYETTNFKKTPWKQTSNIIVDGEIIGTIEVCYLKEKPEIDDGPFLKEEKNLINEIAGRLGLITERKRAEKSLQMEKAYFEQFFESAPEAVVMTENNGQVIRLNKEFTRMFGYTFEEAKDRLIDDLVATGDLRKEALFITEKLAKGEPIAYESVRKRKNGTQINVSILGTPIKISDGQIATYAIYRDITDRKKVEKKLRASEEKYRTLTENINVGVFRSTPGPKGKFLEVNPAMLKIFGFENKEEFLAINVSDLYQNPVNRTRFSKRMLKDGFVKNEESVSKKKDGTIFTASDTAVAVKDEKGNVLYYDGIVEDITERKKLEEERLNRSEIEAINNMVVTINHEMNQPLSIICSNAEALLKEIDKDSKIYKDLKIINKAAWRLADLVRKTQRLREIKTSEYAGGIEMIDLSDDDA